MLVEESISIPLIFCVIGLEVSFEARCAQNALQQCILSHYINSILHVLRFGAGCRTGRAVLFAQEWADLLGKIS
jgi:hypothetical protein